jgi:GNAT superfamily N-acetyltransferase
MAKRNDEYYLLCITDSSDAIVGTGALIVERKFIHQLGLVGHIEDIAVAKDQQGKKLGLRIIQALDFVAEKVGCYKVRWREVRLHVACRNSCVSVVGSDFYMC